MGWDYGVRSGFVVGSLGKEEDQVIRRAGFGVGIGELGSTESAVIRVFGHHRQVIRGA